MIMHNLEIRPFGDDSPNRNKYSYTNAYHISIITCILFWFIYIYILHIL